MLTATLTDRLPEIIDSVWDDLVELMRDKFIADGGDLPDLYNDLDYSGDFSSLCDSAVPIYTSELNELAYFHHDAALAALTDTYGSADGDWPMGPFAAGLYHLIEQGVAERFNAKAEELWEEWTDAMDTPTVREFALAEAKRYADELTAKQEADAPTSNEVA